MTTVSPAVTAMDTPAASTVPLPASSVITAGLRSPGLSPEHAVIMLVDQV